MDPLTIMLIGAGISAGTQAIGGAIRSRKQKKAAETMFSEEDARRLRELQRAREAGTLGLTERQELSMEARQRAGRAAAAREGQSERLAMQAAAPASARDVFLQQMAAEQARQQEVTAENLAMQQADTAARAEQLGELERLVNQRSAAAQLAAGGAGTGLAAAGAAAGAGISQYGMQAAAMQQATAQTGYMETDELIKASDPAGMSEWDAYA